MLRHIIRLTSRLNQGVDTVVFTSHLSFWLENFANSPNPFHSTRDWQVLSINRCEGNYVLALECIRSHLINLDDFDAAIPIKRETVNTDRLQLLLASDVVIPWLLAYSLDGYMTATYKIISINEEN